ncbi:leucine-rich repeat-containing protein 74B-like [Hydractinia symbiolongicarpus]|uniref:leucine-rich repeat-containing protein 74B-like n=1 Tax=Hydractinia symbiolongicarpus TaxID=13093 RepID=UPI00254DA5D2|nr:leucine-rich repeat-containing protein 74B-like [Hydractinia symbiolongicarpus]
MLKLPAIKSSRGVIAHKVEETISHQKIDEKKTVLQTGDADVKDKVQEKCKAGDNNDSARTHAQKVKPTNKLYLKTCEIFRSVPLHQVSICLQYKKPFINLRHMHISTADFKALFFCLRSNNHVTKINLKDTNLNRDVFADLQMLLKKNSSITNLNLSYNNFSGLGAKLLVNVLKSSAALTSLKLRSTSLRDADALYLCRGIDKSEHLRRLDLSHNSFCEQGGKVLAKMILTNKGLEHLDLSWNHIRLSGACALAKSLKNNNCLQKISLAFNGFGDAGAKSLSCSLVRNKTLCSLNVRDNRITNEGAYYIAVGLSQNKALKVLDISSNLITSSGVQSLLTGVIKGNTLNELYLHNTSPDKTCEKAIQILRQRNPEFRIEHGMMCTSEHENEINEDYIIRLEVLELIRQYMVKERLRMLDLFKIWDKQKDGKITSDELIAGLNDAGIPVTKDILEKTFRKLDSDQDGFIDFAEFNALSYLK